MLIKDIGQCDEAYLFIIPPPYISVNTKYLHNISTMVDQRRRRWVDASQILYKCFALTGMSI